ncbi:MAG: accessory factor UbiK family protein [Betaproteobacteria bacterium]
MNSVVFEGFRNMLDKKIIEDLAKKINDLVKSTPVGDVQKNVKAAVAGWLASHDLVTREEFDVQVSVLRRAQEKLTVLEKKIQELESVNESNT